MFNSANTGGSRSSKAKLYESYNWMRKKYHVEHLTEEEIAEEAGTTQPTIHRWLVKHGLIKRRQ